VLEVGADASLRVMVTASNAYTHATTTKIAHYGSGDLVEGRFRQAPGRPGLEMVAEQKQLEADSPVSDPSREEIGQGANRARTSAE
jgi:hypothetical protein